MYRKLFVLFIVIICGFFSAFAEGVTVKGRAVDGDARTPLISATVLLRNASKEVKYHDITNKKGEFEMTGVKPGTYELRITYIGYDSLEQELKISGRRDVVNLGEIPVKPSSITTADVEVTAKAPVGEQHEDTTIINASRFKTQPDATAEDLVKKMPGIQIDNTGVKAHGEDVKKVLVDGKPFFGDDPSVALKNLPAEVIDKVQIYDKMSDQAEFSGFDDGNSVKTLNIMTKKAKMNGQFGKLSAGYGTSGKYIVSGNYNYFDGPERLSILGLTNNINQQNFNFMDILDMFGGGGQRGQMFRQGGARIFGAMRMTSQPGDQKMFQGGGGGPGGMSDFFSGIQDGVNTTHALGLNFNDNWYDKVDFSGSYFINYTNNINNQDLDRNYLVLTDSLQRYNQQNNSTNINQNHRMNFKVTWAIDTSNSIVDQPNLTYQRSRVTNDLASQNLLLTQVPINTSNTDYGSKYSGMNFSNDLLLRHRFIPGRTLSLNINTSFNDKLGNSDLYTLNTINRNQINIIDTIKQQTNAPISGYGLGATAVYTEPIHEGGQLQFNYNLSYNYNSTDKRTYDYNYALLNYDLLDSILSNSYDNNYLTNKAGIGYRLKNDKINVTALLYYQNSELKSNQVYPHESSLDHTYGNFLPSLRFNYKFSSKLNLFLNYRTSTNMPSVQQLQNVIDNSNSMQLSMGNPDLKQQYSHSIMARIANFSEDFTNIFHGFISVNFRSDYIGNSTMLAHKDTLIENKIVLPVGGQITKPVNLDGFMNATGFVTYGFPLIFMSSNVNLNVGGLYTKTPSLINGLTNYSNSYNLNLIFVLSSNISEKLDFTLTSRASLINTKNTLQSSQDNKYNSYTTALNFKWIFWEGFFFEADFRNQFYTGLVQQNNNQYNLLNFGLGKKFLENNAAEIKLSVFDALKQNKSINTNITDYYVEYAQNTVLQQYIMLTFSYNVRKFKMFGFGF